MRILHSADIHLGVTLFSKTGTKSRIRDLSETYLRFSQAAVDNNAEVAVLAGDVFNSRRPEPRDMLTLVRGLDIMRQAGITVVITPGNHDGPDVIGDVESQTLHWLAALKIPHVHAMVAPFAGTIKTARGNDLALVTIPYPHQGAYDAVLPDSERSERVGVISRDLDSGIRTMYDYVAERTGADVPIVFVGHVTAVGSLLSSEVSMQLGADVSVSAETLDAFDYGALGHIHRQQKIGKKSMYSGSPEYIKFPEAGSAKGFVLVEVERGQPPRIQVVDSHPRPMLVLDVVNRDGGWFITPNVEFKDAIVHLNIHATSDTDERDITSIVNMVRVGDDSASFVKYEVVRPEREVAESVEIQSSYSPSEALHVWLSANGYDAEPYYSVGLEIMREVGLPA